MGFGASRLILIGFGLWRSSVVNRLDFSALVSGTWKMGFGCLGLAMKKPWPRRSGSKHRRLQRPLVAIHLSPDG